MQANVNAGGASSFGDRLARKLYDHCLDFFLVTLKSTSVSVCFEESVDCHLLSSFCDDSNLHISLFKYVLSTMGVSKESISNFFIGNRFHVKLRILSPENCKQSLRVKSWKAEITAEKNKLILSSDVTVFSKSPSKNLIMEITAKENDILQTFR